MKLSQAFRDWLLTKPSDLLDPDGVLALRAEAFVKRLEADPATVALKGGPGSGRYPKGSGSLVEPVVDSANQGDWNRSPTGEKPFGWSLPSGDAYTVPEITHKVVREGSTSWGYSHGNSQAITGEAAKQMGIDGYRVGEGGVGRKAVQNTATKFLTEIAKDTTGSEEVLYHSFENVKGTSFTVGDTMRLPVTASSGDVGSYGKRLDAEDQIGPPVVFEFEPGTQMAAYASGYTLRDAKDAGYDNVHDAMKDQGYVWSEAIVAGGFKVTGVETKYMGSQHNRTSELENSGKIAQLYGQVVKLKQIETFDPVKGWLPRG